MGVKEERNREGWREIVLRQGQVCIIIRPDDGLNISGLWFGEKCLIEADEERQKSGALYGMPVLFPTPDRVRNNRFLWKGRKIEARMHGFVRKLSFQIDSLENQEDMVRLQAQKRTLFIRRNGDEREIDLIYQISAGYDVLCRHCCDGDASCDHKVLWTL